MRFGENNIFYIKAEKKIIVLARTPPQSGGARGKKRIEFFQLQIGTLLSIRFSTEPIHLYAKSESAAEISRRLQPATA